MSEQKEENLPKGWVVAALEDVTMKVTDGSHYSPKSIETGFPYITVKDIHEDKINFASSKRISREDYDDLVNSGCKPEKDDILFSKDGTVGKVCIVDSNSDFVVLSSLAILRPNTNLILPKYLYYATKTNSFLNQALNSKKGIAIRRIILRDLRKIRLNIAPFLEQRQIIEELETQFSRLDEVIKSIKRMQKNLHKLRATTLKWACEGKLVSTEAELVKRENREFESADILLKRIQQKRQTNWENNQIERIEKSGKSSENDKWKAKYVELISPNKNDLPEISNGWTWATLEQLASFEPNSITDGPFGSNLKSEHYTKEGPRVIRLQNIGDGIFNDVFAHISQAHFENLKKHQVKEGDVVIAALGGTLPRACLIPEFVGEAIVKADCIRFNPNPELVSNEYVNFALNSESVRLRTTSIIHGVGRPRLNLTEIKAIAIPLPPVEEQKRIVAEVKRRFSVIESLETVVKTNLQRAENLRRKILQDAFAGKLVKQNPNDEPASILLERIKNERTQGESEAKRKVIKTPKIMKQKKLERRDLVEVLKESTNKMTPEQLFHESGFNPDEVEEFYNELKRADNAHAIEQEKEDDGSVYLTAKV